MKILSCGRCLSTTSSHLVQGPVVNARMVLLGVLDMAKPAEGLLQQVQV